MSKVRTRFAPSPTGYLHVGNLRTALFAYLIARSQGGEFILRIEDTDRRREVEGAVEKLLSILDWTGLKFDEGYGIGGPYGPYIQSERLAIYEKLKKELLDSGGAYHCFCSPERLEKMRADQQTKKQAPRYDRACRDLAVEEVSRRIKAGEKYVIRQKMPLEGEIVVHDELRGDIKFKAADLEDHVLVKSDGVPTYQFAAMVDDHLMDITHVVRGDEYLSSFPKNIFLFRAFGWQPPKFVHLPLIMNKGGGKLSKRQGDVAVEDYRAKGYLPEALVNFCALLGWHPKGDNELFSLNELVKIFDYKNIGTSPAVFDVEKLDYFNGYYIRQKPLDELTDLCTPYLTKAGFITEIGKFATVVAGSRRGGRNWEIGGGKKIERDYIQDIIGLEQERLKKLSEIGELTEFFFTDKLEYEPELLIWKKMTAEQVKTNLKIMHGLLEKISEKNWSSDSIEKEIMAYLRGGGLKAGDWLWPMRAALTGRRASPGPFEVAEVLGKEESLARINFAIEKIDH